MTGQRLYRLFLAFAIVCAGSALMSGKAMAEAWPRGEGTFFLSLKPEYYATSSYWDREGEKADLENDFRKFSLQPYLEYGLSDNDTLIAKTFYDRLDNGEGTTSGLSDLELGYRRFLGERYSTVFSLGASVLIPLGYDLDESPQLGYDRYGVETTLSCGRGWSAEGLNGYLESGIRYRHYFGYPPDQIRFFLVVGQDVSSQVQIIFENELQWALSEANPYFANETASIDAYYRLFKSTLHARWKFSDYQSLVLSGFRHVWGENTGAGGGFSLSLWWEF